MDFQENNEQESTDVNSIKKIQKIFLFSIVFSSADFLSFCFSTLSLCSIFHFLSLALCSSRWWSAPCMSVSFLVKDTTWKSICKKKRDCVFVIMKEEREREISAFFLFHHHHHHHLVDPRMRQNANQVTFFKHPLSNGETISSIVSPVQFILVSTTSMISISTLQVNS